MKRFLWTLAVAGLCLCTMAGCGGKPEPAGVNGKPANGAQHAHPHVGPHGGVVIELGRGEYHGELMHDDATQTVEIFLLDSALKKSAPTAAESVHINLVLEGKPLQFVLPGAALSEDPSGETSYFKLQDEKLCAGLDAKGVKAQLKVSIGGKDFTGNIEPHTHGDPGHKH